MEINISHDSWHYHIYSWWRMFSNYHKPSWFRENLCHYMRVVLIWAPLGWFFRKPVWGEMRPWMVASILVAEIGTIVGLTYIPEATILFWMSYLTLVITLGAIKVFILIAEKYEKGTVTALVILLIPIWVPILVIGWVLSNTWKYIVKPLYFKEHRLHLQVWLVTTLAFLGMMYQFFGIDGLIRVLVAASAMIAACTVILIFAFIVIEGPKYLKRRRSRGKIKNDQSAESDMPKQKRRPGISTKQLFNQFRKTKTGSRICPYIKLPGQWKEWDDQDNE